MLTALITVGIVVTIAVAAAGPPSPAVESGAAGPGRAPVHSAAPTTSAGAADPDGADDSTQEDEVDAATPADDPVADPPQAPSLMSVLDGLAASDALSPDYDRDLFGEAWADVDGNGCDTRNDVLRRDLVEVVFRADSNGCIVRTGVLRDAYSGLTIAFTRGFETSSAVQIDHVVPLAYAWRHGAASWSDAQRMAFANDPANLQAVDGPTNQAKSDSGPGEWMPPSAAYACDYVERFAAVLEAYDLTVAATDLDAMRRVGEACAA